MATRPGFIPIGETGEFLDSVQVDTPAGNDLHRETVVFADPENPLGLAKVTNTTPASDAYGGVVRIAGLVDTGLVQPTTPADTQPIQDSTDREYTPVATTLTAAGDTTVYTPAAGKRIRLHWIYAINDPVATSSTKITVKMGANTYYVAWDIAKRQQFTGPVDGALVINLSAVGNVALTVFLEEI